MTAKKPQDRKPKLDLTIKRPTKGVELCLDLSLRTEWEAAEVALRDARQVPSADTRLAGGPVNDLARKVDELEQAMRAATVTFTLTGLPRREWSGHVTNHPPRKDDAGDKQLGFNEETIFDEVIPASITAVVGPDGEPVEWSPEQWETLADEMTTKQYADFKNAAFGLNVGDLGARLPKSMAASLVMARTAES